jgi:putative ABC transport system permease protein
MSVIRKDLHAGIRSLIKGRGVTLVAILMLALSIGFNVTIFTVANALLFKAVPFDKDNCIVYIGSRNILRNNQPGLMSYPDLRDLQQSTKSLEGLGAFGYARFNLSDNNYLPESYLTVRITPNTFGLIGQKPVIGRDFTPSDGAPGAPPVAILTNGVWENRYGKNPGIVGQTVRMNGTPTTIIGVMSATSTFPFDAELWTPLIPTAASEQRDIRNLSVFGRVKDSVSIDAVRRELESIAGNLQKEYPATNQGVAIAAQTFQEQFVGSQNTTIFMTMLIAVGVLLAIACANVANLLLARALNRSREISILVAIGARRGDILQRLLIESVLLSVVGGIGGWMLAIWGVRAFDIATTPYGKPPWIDFSMDYRVFFYLSLISIGTGILFGLAPALRLSKLDVSAALKEGGRGSTGGLRMKFFSAALVVTEMALAIILLVSSGLMVRSFFSLYNVPVGADVASVTTMRIELPPAKYRDAASQIAFYDRLKSGLRSVPGVESVATTSVLPTAPAPSVPYELEGNPVTDPKMRPSVSMVVVSPDYFRVWSVSVIRGRLFTEEDGETGLPTAIVNENFAAKVWPNQDPVGKRFRMFTGNTPDPWVTVVGTVPNIAQNGMVPGQVDTVAYLPYRQKPAPGASLIARTLVRPATVTSAFRAEVQKIDPDLAVFRVMPMDERVAQNYGFRGVIAGLFVTFAVVALLLSSIGLYAVMANSVSRRTQEIGLRIVVGATRRDVMRLVVGQAMYQIVVGLVLGVVGAFVVTRFLASALVQVSPSDPLTFAIAAIALTITALLGCVVPVFRAIRVPPVIALRSE